MHFNAGWPSMAVVKIWTKQTDICRATTNLEGDTFFKIDCSGSVIYK